MSSTVEAPSAPRNTEEGRALLQARLSQFGRLGLGLSATFLSLAIAITLILRLPGGVATIISQICGFGISLVVWLVTRRGVMSTRALLVVEALATQIHCAVGIALGWGLPLYARPELIQLFFVNDVLALRAFLVPSTPLRTALFGACRAPASSSRCCSNTTVEGSRRTHPAPIRSRSSPPRSASRRWSSRP